LIKLKVLSELVGGTLFGDPDLEIKGVSPIYKTEPGTITFLTESKYERFVNNCSAAAIITSHKKILKNKIGILVDNPHLAMSLVLDQFSPATERSKGIHKSALVSPQARLGNDVNVGPFAVIEKGVIIGSGTSIGSHSTIGENSIIGDNTIIDSNVHIYHHSQIGNDNHFHSGCVIGSDGFGYVTVNNNHNKIPQIGKVLIGNLVEMGANCTVDRGTIGDTIIGDGCKFDNSIHLAHNVKLGRGCLLTAQVSIAGSATIGEFCVFGGQSGVGDHVNIGDRAMFAAKTGITKSLPGGKIYAGMPAREIGENNRRDAVYTGLKILKKKILEIEQKLETS